MKHLMEQNIYNLKGKLLISGSCVPSVYKESFNNFAKDYDEILLLCLENNHINMAITKITAILSTNNITKLSFISVNRSPHCTQLHYIKHEIYRTMEKENLPDIDNYIIDKNEIYKIDEETIELSKNLIKLQELYQ